MLDSYALDGNNSTDDDNDALTYEWRNGETVLGPTPCSTSCFQSERTR